MGTNLFNPVMRHPGSTDSLAWVTPLYAFAKHINLRQKQAEAFP
jgi:hypothetical protein